MPDLPHQTKHVLFNVHSLFSYKLLEVVVVRQVRKIVVDPEPVMIVENILVQSTDSVALTKERRELSNIWEWGKEQSVKECQGETFHAMVPEKKRW